MHIPINCITVNCNWYRVPKRFYLVDLSTLFYSSKKNVFFSFYIVILYFMLLLMFVRYVRKKQLKDLDRPHRTNPFVSYTVISNHCQKQRVQQSIMSAFRHLSSSTPLPIKGLCNEQCTFRYPSITSTYIVSDEMQCEQRHYACLCTPETN